MRLIYNSQISNLFGIDIFLIILYNYNISYKIKINKIKTKCMKKIKEWVISVYKNKRLRHTLKFIAILIVAVTLALGIICLVNFTIVVKNKVKTSFIPFTNPVEYYSILDWITINGRDEEPDLSMLNGTRMEEYKPFILNASEYYGLPVEVYVGIANAESSFNRFKGNNPWGIGAGGPIEFDSIEHSVNYFSNLVKYYYFAEGKDTPDTMWRKYQGGTNPDWITNVKKYWK